MECLFSGEKVHGIELLIFVHAPKDLYDICFDMRIHNLFLHGFCNFTAFRFEVDKSESTPIWLVLLEIHKIWLSDASKVVGYVELHLGVTLTKRTAIRPYLMELEHPIDGCEFRKV